jgi:hypothetical protein
MTVGEAYDCPSIDVQWSEAHCYAATRQNLEAAKHKYLVKATFDKPVEADKNGWACVYHAVRIPIRLQLFTSIDRLGTDFARTPETRPYQEKGIGCARLLRDK